MQQDHTTSDTHPTTPPFSAGTGPRRLNWQRGLQRCPCTFFLMRSVRQTGNRPRPRAPCPLLRCVAVAVVLRGGGRGGVGGVVVAVWWWCVCVFVCCVCVLCLYWDGRCRLWLGRVSTTLHCTYHALPPHHLRHQSFFSFSFSFASLFLQCVMFSRVFCALPRLGIRSGRVAVHGCRAGLWISLLAT